MSSWVLDASALLALLNHEAARFLRPLTRTAGLSLGDRACLALATSLEVPALTCDRIWTTLNIVITVELIR